MAYPITDLPATHEKLFLCITPTILPVDKGVERPAPKETAPPPGDLQWHRLVLLHTTPSSIIKQMNWGDSSTKLDGFTPLPPSPGDVPPPRNANLPMGVESIIVLPANDSLLIQATDEGFTAVQQIVKHLDVVPRQVQLQTILVTVTEAQAKAKGVAPLLSRPRMSAQGQVISPASLLDELRQAGAMVSLPIILTTANNMSVEVTGDASPLIPPLALTPRVNSDDTVTLNLSPKAADATAHEENEGSPTITAILTTLRTVKSGEMLFFNLGVDGTKGDKRLLFVTPTVLPTAETFEIPALMETSPPNPKQHWYRLPLQHKDAHDLVQRMHWQGRTWPFDYLPAGVERVFPATFDNALLMHSTEEGFEEIRQFVRILDKLDYTFAPRLTYMTVSAKEASLRIAEQWAKALNIFNEAGNVTAFERLIQSGHTVVHAMTNEEAKGNETQMCFLPDVIVDSPRLRSNNTLTLDFTGHNWNGPPIPVSGIHRGDVLVAAWKGSPQVTLIKVDF